jgi:hypothetical protein
LASQHALSRHGELGGGPGSRRPCGRPRWLAHMRTWY